MKQLFSEQLFNSPAWLLDHSSFNSQILLIGAMNPEDLGNVQSGVPG